jgi:hypothetical protein
MPSLELTWRHGIQSDGGLRQITGLNLHDTVEKNCSYMSRGLHNRFCSQEPPITTALLSLDMQMITTEWNNFVSIRCDGYGIQKRLGW